MSDEDFAIERLIADFYAAFDNRDGRSVDREALIAMFAEGAMITRVSPAGADRRTPEAFAAPRVAMLSDGTLTDFHEWEVEAETIELANIATRFSTYEKRGLLNGVAYGGSGYKFIQLQRGADGWKISAILWEDAEIET